MKGLKDMELIIAACVIVFVILYLIFAKDEEYPQKTANSAEKNKEQSSKTEDVKVTDNNKNNIQQETDDKKNASVNIKYEDYRVSKDKMKEILIKAASNLSWSRMFSSSDKLSFVSEFTGRFAIGKINILFEENECSVDCYNDTTEKNELNIKALIIELEAIYEGKENGIGNAVLSDYNKKNSKFGSFLSLVIIVTTVCFFMSDWSIPSCSTNFLNSNNSDTLTCDKTIAIVLDEIVPRCRAAMREKIQYGRIITPDLFLGGMRLRAWYFISLYGEECIKKYNSILENYCPRSLW